MLFGTYLIERGFVTEADVIQALRRQVMSRPPLGELAMGEGLLTAEEVLTVLNHQKDRLEPFGQCAVRLGFLSQDELDGLLECQRTAVRPIGEVLVTMGVLSQEAMLKELASFQRERNERNRAATTAAPGGAVARLVNALREPATA